jgi:putative oxidoreductase
MHPIVSAFFSILGRVGIATIFLMSTIGNKIPQFNNTVGYMQAHGVPMPRGMLVGAIVFLIVGSISVILGFKTRIGATLLLIFLALATFYFHNFWDLAGEARQREMIHFMKNLSMAGAMLFLIGNGGGAGSLDSRRTAFDSQTHRAATS